jgi:hypothetical protein
MTDAFTSILEDILAIKKTSSSKADTWAFSPASEGGGKSLLEDLEMVPILPHRYSLAMN